MTAQENQKRLPFRAQTARVRLIAGLTVVLGPVALALAVALLPGPTWAQVVLHPAFVWLVLTVLVMDGYRMFPTIRRASAHESTLWTTSIAFGAIIALGPRAAVIWPVTGLLLSVARGLPPWRWALNLAQFAGQAAAASLAVVLVDPRLVQGLVQGPPDLGVPTLATVPALVAAALAVRLVNAVVVLSIDMASFGDSFGAVFRRYLRTRGWVIFVQVSAGALVAVSALGSPSLLPLTGFLLLVAYYRFAQTAINSREARQDPLTGLANRTALQAALSIRFTTRRTPTWPVLMLVDLDRFKQVNDALGHAAGDGALRDAAQRIRSGTRSADLVSRIGGDEFAVLLAEGTSLGDAREVADRVLKALCMPYSVEAQWFDIAASIGVAAAPRHGRSAGELLASADQAMYLAKYGGGGVRVHVPESATGPGLSPEPVAPLGIGPRSGDSHVRRADRTPDQTTTVSRVSGAKSSSAS